MEYLTRWRMLLAGDRLTNSGGPISAIALSLGYGRSSSTRSCAAISRAGQGHFYE